MVREGAEAAVIIAVCYAVLVRVPGPAHRSILAVGVAIGAVGSVVAIVGLMASGARIDQAGEDVAEGSMMVVTTIMLGTFFWYLARPARVEPAPSSRLALALGAVAVLLILREAPETAIEIADREGALPLPAIAGSAIGLTSLMGSGVAIAAVLSRVSWVHLSRLVRIGLAVYAAGLLGHAASELADAGVLAPTPVVWDFEAVLPQRGTIGRLLRTFLGYASQLTVRELLVWATTMIAFVGLEAAAAFRYRRVRRASPGRG